jgi:hypothetical protein
MSTFPEFGGEGERRGTNPTAIILRIEKIIVDFSGQFL